MQIFIDTELFFNWFGEHLNFCFGAVFCCIIFAYFLFYFNIFF